MLKLNCSVLNYYFSITVVYILQISVLWCVFMISGTTLNENTFEHCRKKINKYSILKHGLCSMHLPCLYTDYASVLKPSMLSKA